ncbi:anti-sigma-E factor RseA [Pantoea sp. A4]|uniref:anti-sigma-E factor RseA n=1 Tax=Pantoea sp. A4 TaxID=1225184 RepID=UPI00037035BC|nr:anti-sigma-E factor RseA [Pantoea sp. A4]
MQKEQLSALMDGETLDNELISTLSRDVELQQQWQRYHLVRDTMRGDVGEVLHFDISARVAAAIELEPARSNVTPLLPEAQPEPSRWEKMPFWRKARPWAAQLTQVGVAACVSLAVIVGVQQYNQHGSTPGTESSDSPVFNTLPMMGKASPVSLGVPSADVFDTSGTTQQVQEQRRRVNAMLQDYELQRRLHADRTQIDQNAPQQAQAEVPGNQTLGIQ